MKTIYISGPMAGYPELNHPAFNAAEVSLRGAGYGVKNPVDNDLGPGLEWAEYLRADLHLVLFSDGVAVLPGWEASRGARLEVDVAQRLGMPVLPLGVWLNTPPVGPTNPACKWCGYPAGATWSPARGALHTHNGHTFTAGA